MEFTPKNQREQDLVSNAAYAACLQSPDCSMYLACPLFLLGRKVHLEGRIRETNATFERAINDDAVQYKESIIKTSNIALAKLHEGTYGICNSSGEKIPKERLESKPNALIQSHIQEKLENRRVI